MSCYPLSSPVSHSLLLLSYDECMAQCMAQHWPAPATALSPLTPHPELSSQSWSLEQSHNEQRQRMVQVSDAHTLDQSQLTMDQWRQWY